MTFTMISFETFDRPASLISGSPRKIKEFYFTGTASSTTESVNLITYIPEVTTTSVIGPVKGSYTDSAIATTGRWKDLVALSYGSGSVVAGSTSYVAIRGFVAL